MKPVQVGKILSAFQNFKKRCTPNLSLGTFTFKHTDTDRLPF